MEIHRLYKDSGILHEVNPYHIVSYLHQLIDGST